jgi:hypothetical protein
MVTTSKLILDDISLISGFLEIEYSFNVHEAKPQFDKNTYRLNKMLDIIIYKRMFRVSIPFTGSLLW